MPWGSWHWLQSVVKVAPSRRAAYPSLEWVLMSFFVAGLVPVVEWHAWQAPVTVLMPVPPLTLERIRLPA